jgi:ribosomal protein L6P/L9E
MFYKIEYFYKPKQHKKHNACMAMLVVSHINNCCLSALQRYNKKMEIRNDFQKKEKIIWGLFLSVL